MPLPRHYIVQENKIKSNIMEKDFKIICFVRNELEQGRLKGLFHVFGDSFHPDECPFISKFIYYQGNVNKGIKFGLNVDNKFLLISKDKEPEIKSTITNNDVWDILLVSQDITFPQNFTFSKEMLVMYHGNNNENKQYVENNIKENVRKIKPGHHEPREEEGYFYLKGIADAWDAKNVKFKLPDYDLSKEKLIKWFGLNEKLNAALELLHGSLGGTAAKTNILTNGYEKFNLSQIYKKEKIEKKLEDWIKDLKGKNGEEYNNALAIVRDALLEQAGVTGEN